MSLWSELLSNSYSHLVLNFHQKIRSVIRCSASRFILLKYIKKAVGQSEEPSMVWATGSRFFLVWYLLEGFEFLF